MSRCGALKCHVFRYGVAIAGVAAAAVILHSIADHINSTTVALAFLVVVLTTATFLGRNPALVASLAAMLCFNYFFLPPVGTWTIADPQNLVAWAAFTITAVIAGELSAYASRRAREAERLYRELEAAFEKATEAEALKQSEKLKSALLDAVTHDLRTPLTSIKAAVTTLLDSEGGHRTIELSSEGRAEFLNIINEETDRLNKFIEGMVELARIEAGSFRPTGTISSVEEAIAAAIVRADALPGTHRMTVKTDEGLPLVQADARAVAEVLYSLIENAVKYSPDGSKITITAKRKGDIIEIAVNDQGKGIPPEMRERVFEKFQRGESKGPGGLGLGLAIAKGIVEAQNGTIEMASGDNDLGTKAIVRLPIGE